jgi:hypothetical protein
MVSPAASRGCRVQIWESYSQQHTLIHHSPLTDAGRANLIAKRIETSAKGTLDQVAGGFAITAVQLKLEARIPAQTRLCSKNPPAWQKASRCLGDQDAGSTSPDSAHRQPAFYVACAFREVIVIYQLDNNAATWVILRPWLEDRCLFHPKRLFHLNQANFRNTLQLMITVIIYK